MRNHHHAFLIAIIKQALVVFHGLNVGGLDGHKHEYKVWATNAGKVGVIL